MLVNILYYFENANNLLKIEHIVDAGCMLDMHKEIHSKDLKQEQK